MLYKFSLKTERDGFFDITENVEKAITESGVQEGICIVYCPHTTAGITINENADEWVAFTEENIADGACVIVDDPEEHVRIYRVYMPDADFTMTSQLYGENAGEVLLSALSQAPEEQCWFIMDYTQGAFGVERMRSLLNSLGYEMHSVGNYSIEYKNMEIFQIGRNH